MICCTHYSFFFCLFFFFKQKTAYEMLRSLVGSEMCIRDRLCGLLFYQDCLLTLMFFQHDLLTTNFLTSFYSTALRIGLFACKTISRRGFTAIGAVFIKCN